MVSKKGKGFLLRTLIITLLSIFGLILGISTIAVLIVFTTLMIGSIVIYFLETKEESKNENKNKK